MNHYKELLLLLALGIMVNVNANYGTALREIEMLPPAGIMNAAVRDSFLYVIGHDHLHIYEIGNPDSPKPVGYLNGLGSPRQIALQNNIAYITSRQFGLYLVDISDPRNPRLLSQYDTIDMATGISVSGGIAAVACRNHGVELLDVGDPRNPRHLSVVRAGESQSVVIRGKYMYIGTWHNRGLVIADISNPYSPEIVGRAALDGYGDGLDVKGKYCYVATGHHAPSPDGKGKGHGMEIFDIGDPTRPKRTGMVKFPPFYSVAIDMWSVKVVGKYAFVNDTHNGLFVVDVDNPTAPRAVGFHEFGMNQAKKEKNPIAGLAVGDKVIYCAGIWTGLHIVEATNFARKEQQENPEPVDIPRVPPAKKAPAGYSLLPFDFPVLTVAANQNFVYAGLGKGGIQVLKPGPDGRLNEIGRYPTAGSVVDLKIREQILFSAEDRGGMRIWKCGDDGKLTLLSEYHPDQMLIRQIAVYRESPLILLQANSSKLVILNIENPQSPQLAAMETRFGFNYGHPFPDQLIDSRYAGCFWHVNGVYWYDLKSNPVKMVKKNRLDWQTGAVVVDNKLLLLEGDRYLFVTPDSPEDLSAEPRYAAGNRRLAGRRILKQGNHLLLTEHASGKIQSVNIGNPEKPVVESEFSIDGNPGSPVCFKEKILIPAGYLGLLVQQ